MKFSGFSTEADKTETGGHTQSHVQIIRRGNAQMSQEFEFVAATQKTEEAFWSETALGLSLKRLRPRVKATVFFENCKGLPEIYNSRIDSSDSADYLIFIHDDVWIEDFFIIQHLREAFKQFEVVGLAGNKHCSPTQPSWFFVDLIGRKLIADRAENLSGSIGHGKDPMGELSYFGPSPQEVKILDGVFIAVSKQRLLETGVRFDEQFAFHFYDVDFSRTAVAKGLNMGTYPIAVTHQSKGRFKSKPWMQAYALSAEMESAASGKTKSKNQRFDYHALTGLNRENDVRI